MVQYQWWTSWILFTVIHYVLQILPAVTSCIMVSLLFLLACWASNNSNSFLNNLWGEVVDRRDQTTMVCKGGTGKKVKGTVLVLLGWEEAAIWWIDKNHITTRVGVIVVVLVSVVGSSRWKVCGGGSTWCLSTGGKKNDFWQGCCW